MDTIQSSRQHRTFARSNGLGSGAAIPHLVAAEERHRKNLQHIRQLKLTLCSTVSSAAPQRPSTPPSRGESLPSSSPSLPSPALQVWGGRGGALRDSSTGVVASRTTSALPPPSLPTIATNATAPPPQRARETPISAAALQSSQDEVEELVREKHRLQRQCVELASLLADTHHGGGASAALAAAGSATEDASAWSPVHDAAVAVVEQVARCYPDVVREWATATNGGDGAVSSNAQSRLRNTAETASLATVARDACSLPSAPGEASLTADELADALHRLADFLPQLASMTAISKLVAEAGPDMLDHIHALEEEKRSDCVAVLSIADHLSTVSAQMRREAAEKDAALHALQQAVGDLLEEKQEWARRARASEAALAERYTQYRQREKAWEREVGELLQAKDSFAAAVPAGEVAARIEDATAATRAVAEERGAELQQQLVLLQKTVNESAADLGDMKEAHDALQATHAALQTSSRATIAAQQERIAVLEGQLHPLEAELRTQSDTISATLRKVEELTAAHGAEVSTLERTHQRVFAEKEAALAELQASKEVLQAELAKVTASVAQRTTELDTMTAARDALQAALEEREQISVADSASFFATASTPLRLTRVVDSSVDGGEATAAEESAMNSPSGLGNEDDAEESGDALFRTTNVRKLQQSLKRMSRERAALKRKLEHRGAALAEMEAELEAAQRLVAQQEAHAQVLQAELESVRATSATVAEAAEPVTAAAAPREEGTPAQKQKEAMPATTPINWIAFSELEEHAEEGTLYPNPVDLQGWLLNRRDPQRFADYVAHHLSQHDQLLVAAVGPLYHIGFNLLRAEGYLGDDLYFPVIWRRVLLQLQQVLDVQLEGLSVSAADCAHRFYALATAAGLFKALRDSSDVLTAYTLILASLSVCLGVGSNSDGEKKEKEERLEPARSDPLPASESHFTTPSGRNATKWQSCQAVLRHVCSQGDGEAATQRRRSSGGEEGGETPFALLTRLAQQDVETVSACSTIESDVSGFRQVEAGDSRSSAVLGMSTVATAAVTPTHRVEASPSHTSSTPWFTLASLLSHGLLTDVESLSCYALQAIVLQQFVLSRTTAGDGTEHRLSSRTPTPPSPSSVRLTQVALLLYIARFELLLEGWTAARPAAAEEVVSLLPSIKSLGVDGGANCEDGAAGVLMLLDTGLLPAITMSIFLCRCLEHEPHLLPAFFETRQAVLSSREAAAAQGEVLFNGVPLLSEAQMRDCVQQVLAPVKPAASTPSRVVQVPVAEYERLHRELLSLYQSNETYEAHLQELLGAVEGV